MRLLSYVEDSLDPVTVAEAKLAARVDDDLGGGASSLDAEVQALITSAREQAEHLTGRIYRPQVRRAEWLDWPATGDANEACSAEVVNVLSTSSDVVIGPFKGDTAAAVHARFNGAGCVVTKPMNASSGAALTVGGGAIAGTGTPVVWVPA